MAVAPFVLNLFFVTIFVGFLHWHYGNWKRQQLSVTLVTLVAWTLPFMIIVTLPIDVSVTFFDQCMIDNNNASIHVPTTTTPAFTSSIPTNASSSTKQILPTPALAVNLLKLSNYSNYSTIIANHSTTIPTTATTTTDISTTLIPLSSSCIMPWTYLPTTAISIFWHIVYWTSQCLTWIWLPMMQSYAKAGEFTFLGKFRYALIVNAIYYGTYLIIFGCCLVYLAVTSRLVFNLSQLKVLAITASNTWGLTLLVLLLGYGLVELPRSCWKSSKVSLMLARCHFKVAKLTMEKIEAEEELEDVLGEVRRVAESISQTNPLRKFVDIILKKCPTNQSTGFPGIGSSSSRAHFDRTDESHMTEKILARLHRRLIVAKQRQSCSACQWRKVVTMTMELEDVEDNMRKLGVRSFERSPGVGPYEGPFTFLYSPKAEWHWKCRVKPWLLKIVAAATAIFSMTVVWSECLFFVKSPVLSLFAQFISLAKLASGYHAIEFVCILTIAYLSACTYYTIFKMRIFNYYYLVGPHETDENSMIFCGMLLCRLTPPLCLNFLGLIHLDSHITKNSNMVETAYTRFMGNMDVLQFISDGFNIYFPIAIVALCALTLFGVGTRVLHCLGFQQFVGDDDMTQEMVDEGIELIKRERRKRNRQEETETKKRTWREKAEDREGASSAAASSSSSVNRRITQKNGSDRSELLNDAEPMGYRSYDDNAFVSASEVNRPAPRSLTNDPTRGSSGLYQQSPLDTGVRPVSGPPRNIFDDV